MEAAKEAATFAWDLSIGGEYSKASQARNLERCQGIMEISQRFAQGSMAERLEIGSGLVTGGIFGLTTRGATLAGGRAIAPALKNSVRSGLGKSKLPATKGPSKSASRSTPQSQPQLGGPRTAETSAKPNRQPNGFPASMKAPVKNQKVEATSSGRKGGPQPTRGAASAEGPPITPALNLSQRRGSSLRSSARSAGAKSSAEGPVGSGASSSSSNEFAQVYLSRPVVTRTPQSAAKTRGIPEQQLTGRGLSHPEALLPRELSKVRVWQHARNQYLKHARIWQTKSGVSQLSKNTRKLLEKADNSVRNGMKPDDLSGICKESRGIKIIDRNGKVVDHLKEWNQTSNALRNAITNIKAGLKELQEADRARGVEARLLQEKLSELSKTKDLYSELTREERCLIEAAKLKP